MLIGRARQVIVLLLASAGPSWVGLMVPGPSAARAPAPFALARERHTRNYRFTARVKDNGGVSPFRVGALITGTFTYGLRATKIRPQQRSLPFGHYQSRRNSITFQLGDLRFAGKGPVLVTVSSLNHSEHFGVVAPDLELPRGWEMDHTQRSQTYGFLLQNAPPKKVITRVAIPERVSLADFVSTREVRLDFFHGVRFPGGQVKGRATVYASVERLEEVRR
jgi:hypothetical protein